MLGVSTESFKTMTEVELTKRASLKQDVISIETQMVQVDSFQSPDNGVEHDVSTIASENADASQSGA